MKKFGDRHLIFTLDQPYFQKPGYEGINSTSDLVDHLTSKGIPHHRTIGQYQDPEQGIYYKEDTVALKDPSDQDIKTHLDLAQKQGQESAILRHGDKWHMLYLNGPLAGKKLTAQHYEEYAQPPTKKPYVTTPGGSHASIKFNDQPESYEINDLLRPDKDTSLQKDQAPEGHQKLVHYSVTPGLDIIDPNKQGIGAKGQENKHGVPDVRASYWYKSGTEPESVVTQGQKSIYTKTLTPDHKIYDLATDPDQIGKKLYESSLQRQVNPGQVTRDELLGQIRDSGYHGFTNSKHPSMNNVVQLFHQHRPETEEPVTPKHFEDLRNRIYKTEQILSKAAAPNVNLNPEHGKIIASAYDQMKHDPNHPQVKAAYGALINETKQQYQDMLNQGFKFTKIKPKQANPYNTSKDVHADLKQNKHLHYFPTENGYGPEGAATSQDHPLLQPTEFKDHEGKPMLANDLFRIVHDYRGHHLGGESTFGPRGEHQAFLTHKKDFSPLAQKALASETMGQNSFVNFGPNGQFNRQNPHQTIYAEQKAGLLPDHIINGNWHT